MKTALISLAAVAALAAAATPAAAQPYGAAGWQPINQRQANLDHRIDAGVRRGDLTVREAVRLRAEFRQVARLEARYRVNGLSAWERRDLERRLDGLDAQVRVQRHDGNHRGHW